MKMDSLAIVIIVAVTMLMKLCIRLINLFIQLEDNTVFASIKNYNNHHRYNNYNNNYSDNYSNNNNN